MEVKHFYGEIVFSLYPFGNIETKTTAAPLKRPEQIQSHAITIYQTSDTNIKPATGTYKNITVSTI